MTETTKVVFLRKDVFGSLSQDNKFEDDTLVEVIEWLQDCLEQIPEEYRATACIDVDSIGGYEGEHHTEIGIYYERPTTAEELAKQAAERRRYHEAELARHQQYADQARAALAKLK